MDQASKRARVEQIESEVKELHPLLEGIFKDLAKVQYVEYTHGPNEKGADFVIERRDDDLGVTSYIGVVAKSAKILQSFDDVERQIDECGHARLIKNGQQNVRLPEVWVITSKSVSHNAKEKICEKFSSKKIHFFDADWLVAQIDLHARHFWDEVDGDVGKYLAQLDKRLGIISAQSVIATNLLTAGVEIEVDVEEIETDRYVQKKRPPKPRLVNIREEVLGNKVSVIEAQMGFGKSHLARRLCSHFADIRNYKAEQIIPLYTTFKSYADSGKSIDDFVKSTLGDGCAIHAEDEADTRLLIILDGLDEAYADQDTCKEKVDELVKAVKKHDNWRLVLTSRPWRGLEELSTQNEGVKRYSIRPLSIAKIVNYLKHAFERLQMPSRLVNDLAKSELFKQLPQNPMAATLLINIVNQEKYELPSSLTELYAKTVELMLGRWDERRQISTEKQYKASERLARLLARHMVDNQLIYMSKAEIREMFKSFLADRQTGISLDETFDYLINRSNLFGVFDDTDAVFFRHRSFAEYLYAKDAYEARNLPISDRAFDTYWLNIYFFYIGIRAECPEIIDELVRTEPAAINQRVQRLLSMGNYLLAGYQTPYSHVRSALDSVILEASRLYLDIQSGRVPSSLTSMTQMQLLWVFTQIVRHYYGYEFFKTGLPISMLTIDEKLPAGDEARPYALFFAACTLADLEDTSGFKYLLANNSASSLPVQISLALKCEMELSSGSFANSKPVKDFDRKLKRLLNVSADERIEHNARINALFHAPISATTAAKKTVGQNAQRPVVDRQLSHSGK